jgi:hypothetical protein
MVKPPAEGLAQLKKLDFFGFVAGKLSGRTPVVKYVGTKSHGICAGKSYGRASEAVMDKQN